MAHLGKLPHAPQDPVLQQPLSFHVAMIACVCNANTIAGYDAPCDAQMCLRLSLSSWDPNLRLNRTSSMAKIQSVCKVLKSLKF